VNVVPSSDRPRFPSDELPRTGEPFALAGRVVHRDPAMIWLADAFVTTRVHGDADLDVGDLVVLVVHRNEDRFDLDLVRSRMQPNRGTPREATRLLGEGVGPNLQARAQALAGARRFFAARGFVEVDTPLLVRSPGLDLHLDAVGTSSGYLITSPEYQMKRLLVGGMPRIYQLSHVFRRGEAGPLHHPEFTMIEWYRAFAGVDEILRDTEELVITLAHSLRGRADLSGPRGVVTLETPFMRLPVAQAFEQFAGVGAERALALSEEDPDAYFRLLVERVEPALAAETRPVFLVDYPIAQASLARAKPDDPRVCERFELYVGGVELCNGFGELTDPDEQRRRLLRDQATRAALGRDVYPIDELFLDALREGMPPSAGNALGFDRLLLLCLGERDLHRVLPLLHSPSA
jgi:lysyl-tRNA synthetase class 2